MGQVDVCLDLGLGLGLGSLTWHTKEAASGLEIRSTNR